MTVKIKEARQNKIDKNIMRDPEFWFSKGHNIQTHTSFNKDSSNEGGDTKENKH